MFWLALGTAHIREGVAEWSSIYSVCGGGCRAGTYNCSTAALASSSPDSEKELRVYFLARQASELRRLIMDAVGMSNIKMITFVINSAARPQCCQR